MPGGRRGSGSRGGAAGRGKGGHRSHHNRAEKHRQKYEEYPSEHRPQTGKKITQSCRSAFFLLQAKAAVQYPARKIIREFNILNKAHT